MLIERIAARCGDTTVTDYYGAEHGAKLLNTAYIGIRRLHTDKQGVAPADSALVAGSIITFPGGKSFTISSFTPDFHRGKRIRYWMDMVENNNQVSVKRVTTTMNPQGGISGKSEVLVYPEPIPVKIGSVFQMNSAKLDITDLQFGMLLSSAFPVQRGDLLIFDTHYEPAKIEAVKLNHDGISEILFDMEPRWQS